MKRLRKVDHRTVLWYAGNKKFILYDLGSLSIVREWNNVIQGLSGEAIGYFDVIDQKYLVCSTYAKDKRLLYLHNLLDDNRIYCRTFFDKDSILSTNIHNARNILGRLSILQWLPRQKGQITRPGRKGIQASVVRALCPPSCQDRYRLEGMHIHLQIPRYAPH